MTKEDYMNAIIDTLVAIRNLEEDRAKTMREFREKRQQLDEELDRYIAKYTGKDLQEDLF